ncbi:hypothetical protein BKA83DRAFT_4133149 [Pisolithus microcarpus]|nr:hypothetical protein BKA83DRAFT_4133149 [Pisolithus microcarpus]
MREDRGVFYQAVVKGEITNEMVYSSEINWQRVGWEAWGTMLGDVVEHDLGRKESCIVSLLKGVACKWINALVVDVNLAIHWAEDGMMHAKLRVEDCMWWEDAVDESVAVGDFVKHGKRDFWPLAITYSINKLCKSALQMGIIHFVGERVLPPHWHFKKIMVTLLPTPITLKVGPTTPPTFKKFMVTSLPAWSPSRLSPDMIATSNHCVSVHIFTIQLDRLSSILQYTHSTMARTKQTARKTTGDKAHRISLLSFQKRKGKASAASKRPTPKQKASTSSFCVMCRDGGGLWICNEKYCQRVVCNKCLVVPEEEKDKPTQDDVTFKCVTCHWRENQTNPQPYFEYQSLPTLVQGSFQHAISSQVASLPTPDPSVTCGPETGTPDIWLDQLVVSANMAGQCPTPLEVGLADVAGDAPSAWKWGWPTLL